MHRLLKRQVNRLFGDETPANDKYDQLIDVVNGTYHQFQDDYNNLERILELSSRESFKELSNFKIALDTAALVSLTDARGDILLANENFCRVSGYALNELIGKNHNIVNSGYHDHDFWKHFWLTISQGGSWQGEICNRKKNGELYWVNSTIVPFLGDNGKPYQYLSIRFEITERKNFEHRLEENQRLLKALNSASAELLANPDLTIAVTKSLQVIGSAFGAEHVHIFKNNARTVDQPVTFSQRFEWSQASNTVTVDNPLAQNITYASVGLERWYTELSDNKVIKTNDPLPDKEKVVLNENHIAAAIALPVFIFEEFWGFLSIDSFEWRNWGENHEEILRNIAGNIGSAFERHETDKRMRQSEEKFRLLIESATDIFYYTDEAGNFTYVNDVATQITGFSTPELLRMNYLDLVEPGQRERVEAFYKRQAFSGKKVTYNEFPIITKSGRVAWMGQNVQLIQNEDKTRGIQAIARDITSLKNAQLEIENSHHFLNEIIDSIPNPLFVKNRKQQWVIVNNAYTRLTGIARQHILGHKEEDFLPVSEAHEFYALDELLFNEPGEEVREVVYKTNESDDKNLLVKKSVFNNRGEPFLVAVITDITERKLAEEKVDTLKTFYETVLNKIPSDVVVFDHRHRYVFVNEMAVKDPEKRKWLVGHDDYEYCEYYQKGVAIADERRKLFNTVKDNKGQLEYEEELTKSDGSVAWFLRRFYPIINQANEIDHIIGFGIDITSRIEAEAKTRESQQKLLQQEKAANQVLVEHADELEKKNKELDQFAYIVSHDLKAPLRGINNLSAWIEEDLEGKLEADTEEKLTLMRNRVKRMEGLINGILEYSRAGRVKHKQVAFELKDAVDEIISSLAVPEHFEVTVNKLPDMLTEKIAIEQVFSNYISNAIKYNNNPQPRVEISYKRNGDYYEFCVADNGPGIEKAFYEKVFVIFQTLQARDTFESTGVGLAIVKKMVEDKGGRVWIDSELGKGSKFYFSWPVTEAGVE